MDIIKSILLTLALLAAYSLEARAFGFGGIEIPKPIASPGCDTEDEE